MQSYTLEEAGSNAHPDATLFRVIANKHRRAVSDGSDQRHYPRCQWARLPGATVKATQTATGVSRTAISGADGGYVLPNLPIGPCLVEVTKDGLNKYAQCGIVLEVNTAPTLDGDMKVGLVSEQVTVEAAAIQVETRTQSGGQVVDTARVLEMPLNGRGPRTHLPGRYG